MAPPLVTLHYKFEEPDVTFASGTVTMVLSDQIRDPVDDIFIQNDPITQTLDVNGEATFVVVANDAPGVFPPETTYTVTERIGSFTRTKTVFLPYAVAAVEYADLDLAMPGTTYVPPIDVITAIDFKGFQQITNVSSSTALTIPSGATRAVIYVEGANVRYRIDGDTTAPTASVGMFLPNGSTTPFLGSLSTTRFIQESAGAKLNVSYFL